MNRPSHLGLAFAVAIAATLLAGCVSGTSDTFSGPTRPTPTPSPTVAASGDFTTESDSSLNEGLQVTPGLRAASTIVGWLNGPVPLAEEYETIFDEAMLAALPYDAFVLLHLQLSVGAPYEIDDPSDTGPQASVVLHDSDGVNSLQLTVVVQDGLVAGMFFSPVSNLVPPTTLDEAIEVANGYGTFRYLIAEPGSCDAPLSGHGDAELVPIASIFKLYVLGALVQAVDANTAAWDEEIPIQDALDTLPSGITQDDPDGELITVRELADRMISISDNTATDHLIDYVGREAVDAALFGYGHSNPIATVPIITAGEMFKMKYSLSDPVRATYADLDLTGRREFLADVLPTVNAPRLAEFDPRPVAVNSIEWFATPRDLCRAITLLRRDEIATEILGNIAFSSSSRPDWEYQGFKGGSEPGVISAVWSIDGADGRSRVIVASIVNEESILPFNSLEFIEVFRNLAFDES